MVKIYPCSCTGEGISIEKDDDLIMMSFWQRGFLSKSPLNIKERLRWCWQVITKGDPWNDMVVFDKKTAKDIVDDLSIMLNEIN